MGSSDNTMSGPDWIGESRHAFCICTARHFEQQQKEVLDRSDLEAAAKYERWGQGFLWETQHLDSMQQKRIVSDVEGHTAARRPDEAKQGRADAEHLATLKTRLGNTPRANGSAYRPYRGGLPTLGKDR
ncbi:hypothetical protein [Streptomyces collinus]|uniref:hypothetical protein n=1 Tax=Streptomyces collinus TaxID=42684 RepID=UPI003420FE38